MMKAVRSIREWLMRAICISASLIGADYLIDQSFIPTDRTKS